MNFLKIKATGNGAFQNGALFGNTKGPGYCQKISDFIVYPFNVNNQSYVISGAQMSYWSVSNWCQAQGMSRIQSLPSQEILGKLKMEFSGGNVWLMGNCHFFITSGWVDCSAGQPDSFYAMCYK